MDRRLPAALAALVIGAGFGGACGSGDGGGGGRENVEQGNEGELTPEGGEVQTETSPGVTAAPTQTETQPEVTQPETGP